jgi:hypothetical protein
MRTDSLKVQAHLNSLGHSLGHIMRRSIRLYVHLQPIEWMAQLMHTLTRCGSVFRIARNGTPQAKVAILSFE